jgi:Uma2 family endonuclease
LPEEEPALEYVDGEVVQKVSPKTWHSELQAEFTGQMRGFARPRRLAHVLPEHRSTYGGRSTVPDIAVYRWGRIPRDRRGRLVNDVTIPPDIAVEIVSPDQSLRELIAKCRWYVANGVRIALILDPDDSTIRDFRPDAEPVVLRAGDVLDLSDVLPGFTLDVGSLFDVLTEG